MTCCCAPGPRTRWPAPYVRDGRQAACLAELDTARAGIAVTAGRPSLVAGVFNEGLHLSIHGKCLVQLSRPTEAVEAAERSLATLDRIYVCDVAFTTADLDLALLECGERDHAVTTLEQAVDLAVQNRSARLAGQINAVWTRTQPWQDSAAVIQLDQRLRAYQLA